jgi:hypothetical protein
MRKHLVGTISFAALFILSLPALSKPPHQIGGHGPDEISEFCGAVGGSFGIWDSPGGGSISFQCSWGPNGQTTVSCNSNGGPTAKGLCVSNYDPKDPDAPRLPPPKGKKSGGSKNVAKPAGKANTGVGANTQNLGHATSNAPQKTNVVGTAASARAGTGIKATPVKPFATTPSPLSGAFGTSESPTMHGPAGVAGRKLP